MASNGFSKRHSEKIEIKSACFNILALSLNGKKAQFNSECLINGIEKHIQLFNY